MRRVRRRALVPGTRPGRCAARCRRPRLRTPRAHVPGRGRRRRLGDRTGPVERARARTPSARWPQHPARRSGRSAARRRGVPLPHQAQLQASRRRRHVGLAPGLRLLVRELVPVPRHADGGGAAVTPDVDERVSQGAARVASGGADRPSSGRWPDRGRSGPRRPARAATRTRLVLGHTGGRDVLPLQHAAHVVAQRVGHPSAICSSSPTTRATTTLPWPTTIPATRRCTCWPTRRSSCAQVATTASGERSCSRVPTAAPIASRHRPVWLDDQTNEASCRVARRRRDEGDLEVTTPGRRIAMLGTGLDRRLLHDDAARRRSRDRVAVVYSRSVERGEAFMQRAGAYRTRRRASRTPSTIPTSTPSSSACPTTCTRRRSASPPPRASPCCARSRSPGPRPRPSGSSISSSRPGVFGGYLEDLVYTPKTLKAVAAGRRPARSAT